MKTGSRHPLFFGTASLILASVAVYGCKNFLSDAAAPQGTLDQATLANQAGVEGNLIAAYRALDWNNGVGGNWGNAASNWVWGSVTSDDAYKGSEASDQPPIDDVEEFHWSTANVEGYLNDKWRGAYEGVVRSNATLRLLKSVMAASPGLIATAAANSIEGEATFLRAHYHFEAYRMWGNIPYYKEDDLDFRKANGTSAEAITNILADLDAAIAKLPTTPRNGQKGRVTSWTAKAYKGRVQVYAKQYAAAITTLKDVQASGPFALEASFDQVWSGFADLQNGKETILAYQASSNDGGASGNNANYGERLNFPHSGSHFGCCGFHQPSQNLVNFFAVDGNVGPNFGLPLSLSSPATWNASSANFIAGAAQAVDPRLDWTVGRDGVPYKDWGLHASGWIRSPAYGGTYSPKKNVHEKASGSEQTSGGWAPQQQNAVNIHIFRYADLLLLLAEAQVEAGGAAGLTDALAIVNQIRTRAGQKVQGPGTDRATIAIAITDAHPWANYQISTYTAADFATQASARDRVRLERRLELAMEGQRFFDLRRWGIADQVLNAYIHDGIGGGTEKTRRTQLAASDRWVGLTDPHYLFPIPNVQIQLSKVDGACRLQQNPGWGAC